MRPFGWIAMTLAIGLLTLPHTSFSQEADVGHACPAGEECPTPRDHEGMEARHDAMMAQHEQSAARLQELQGQMHAASGEAKVEAIEALLDEMLAEHRAMHAMMMGMHGPGAHHDGMKREADPDSGR